MHARIEPLANGSAAPTDDAGPRDEPIARVARRWRRDGNPAEHGTQRLEQSSIVGGRKDARVWPAAEVGADQREVMLRLHTANAIGAAQVQAKHLCCVVAAINPVRRPKARCSLHEFGTRAQRQLRRDLSPPAALLDNVGPAPGVRARRPVGAVLIACCRVFEDEGGGAAGRLHLVLVRPRAAHVLKVLLPAVLSARRVIVIVVRRTVHHRDGQPSGTRPACVREHDGHTHPKAVAQRASDAERELPLL